jgi:uncharacterized membrane protein
MSGGTGRVLIRVRRGTGGRMLPVLIAVAMVLAYITYMSALSLQRHATLNSYAADLSFIDQPMWNTLHGRFLERTMDARQVSRAAEHFEPIILAVALVYTVWDDVRAILIIQSVVLALGAVPIYWLARRAFRPSGMATTHTRQREDEPPGQAGVGRLQPILGQWLPPLFVLVYLMFPALQAANVADFHADPFIVAPWLFAFWYATERRYRMMWFWAIIALMAKENLPPVVFTLGLFLMIFGGHTSFRPETPSEARARRWHAASLMVVSLAWFGVATYLIVMPLAREVYGTSTPVYMAHRYAWLASGVGGIRDMLLQPERWYYLIELLAPVGWLALLAPEFLLPGLPVLVANFMSDFPAQYSGQQHYTAPLVPVMVVAGIYGARRLWDWLTAVASRSGSGAMRLNRHRMLLAGLSIWLVGWSLGFHHLRGWTPLARDFEWPRLTAHHRLLARFTAQIPGDAAVSTTPPLHPHLAHRWKIYLYPTVADADYVLLDITGRTDAHPNDVYRTFNGLINGGGFTIQDAADGYVLLARRPASGVSELPPAFYDFARVSEPHPEHPVGVEFAPPGQSQPHLRLLGYDLVDDAVWRQTAVRCYWQALAPLPEDTRLWPFFFDDTGLLIEDTSLRPMVVPIWYPPSRWETGETIITETLPWELGDRFTIGVAVLNGGEFGDPSHRFRVTAAQGDVARFQGDTWAAIGTFTRVRRHLAAASSAQPARSTDTTFEGGIRLVGYRATATDNALSVVLIWQAELPLARDYTVFVHLVTSDGTTVAQSDAQPHWVAPWPTSRWEVGRPTPDGHRLDLPGGIDLATTELHVGLYDWQTLERVPVLDVGGQPISDYAVLSLRE